MVEVKQIELKITDDDVILERLGYKKDLHRGLNFFLNFSMGYSEVAVMVCFLSVYDYGLSTGGPSALVWTWGLALIFLTIVGLTFAEICSAFPCAGSVYHWAGQVVPSKWTPLASYVCGWTNFLGNAAQDASFAFSWATFLNSALIITYSASNYEGLKSDGIVGISIGILLFWTVLNCIRIDYLGYICAFGTLLQLGSILLIAVVLLTQAPEYNSAEFVFFHFNNFTGFSSTAYVCAISVLSVLWSTAGYEASAHVSEETHSARSVAPRGILYTCIASGVTGFLLILVMLFTTVDYEAILGEAEDDNGYVYSGNAAMELFRRIGGPSYGLALAWLVVVNAFFAGVTSVGITGRITFSLARDGALPWSDVIAQVHPVLKSPINAIIVLFFIDALLQLLPLVSDVAFDNLMGMSTIGFQLSYAIPIGLRIIFHDDHYKNEVCIPSNPHSLGSWSRPLAVVSFLWLSITSIFLFLPTRNPITEDNMNWCIVVVGGFAFIGWLHWILYARFTYNGPKRFDGVRKSLGVVITDDIVQHIEALEI